ncbi:hypothetical protein M0P48_04935, partial [Candidatus Gracilibacteria bacterium]|nr:hypothetical protein [Candidatus Gracilibacteria bacterium]
EVENISADVYGCGTLDKTQVPGYQNRIVVVDNHRGEVGSRGVLLLKGVGGGNERVVRKLCEGCNGTIKDVLACGANAEGVARCAPMDNMVKIARICSAYARDSLDGSIAVANK